MKTIRFRLQFVIAALAFALTSPMAFAQDAIVPVDPAQATDEVKQSTPASLPTDATSNSTDTGADAQSDVGFDSRTPPPFEDANTESGGNRTKSNVADIGSEFSNKGPSSPDEPRADRAESRVAEKKLQSGLSTAESRRLTEEIAKRELQAANLAIQIRTLNRSLGEGQGVPKKLVESQNALNLTLAETFDLKRDLEQLRVRELQSRLSRLEQQIGQRQSQRTQIIERRARELIEGEATQWSTDPDSSANSDFSTNQTTRDIGTPKNASTSSRITRVVFNHLAGFDGPPPPYDSTIDYLGKTYALPCELNFEPTTTDSTQLYSLQLRNLPRQFDGVSFPLVLRLFPSTTASEDYLLHNSIPVRISSDDLDQFVAGNNVVKVFYLQDFAKQTVETLVSTRLDPGVDIIREANRRGTVLAAIYFYRPGSPISNLETKIMKPNESDSAARDAKQLLANNPKKSKQFPVNNFVSESNATPVKNSDRNLEGLLSLPDSLPSYKELAMSLEVARNENETTKAEFANFEALRTKNVVSQIEFDRAKRRLETAQRKYRIVQDDLTALLNDTEMRLKFAENELNEANELLERFKGPMNGVISLRTLAEANLRQRQADLSVKRLKAAFELYKKVRDEQPLQQVDDQEAKAPHQSDTDRFWTALGMKLVPLPSYERFKLDKTKFRVGMTAIEIDPNGPAAKAGIQKNDVLVGLSKWETASSQNISWILNHFEQSTKSSDGTGSIRFIVVRDQKERDGYITLSPLSELMAPKY